MTVYGLNTCGKCKVFMRKLEEKGVPFEKVEGDETMQKAMEINVKEIPFIIDEGIVYNFTEGYNKYIK